MNDRAVTSSWSYSAFSPVVNGRPVVVTSAVTPTTNDLQPLELNREIQPLELNSETFDDSDSSFINDTSTTSSVTTDDPLEPNRENVANSVPTTDDNVPTIGHDTITLGQIEYGDGGTYIGYMLNGLPHGYGKLIYLDDVSYQGCWYNGQEHGPGTMRWENGSIYDGNFIHGEPHGHGFLSNRTHPGVTKCRLVGAMVHELEHENSPEHVPS